MLAVAVLFAAPAGAAEPAAEVDPRGFEGPEDATEALVPDMDAAQRIFLEGQAKFDAGEIQEAAQLYAQAYERVPPDEAYIGTRVLILMAAVRAFERSHEASKDVADLERAQKLLAGFLDTSKGADPSVTTDANKAHERITKQIDHIRAEEAHSRGQVAFDAGSYQEALDAFEEAESLESKPERLLLIGLSYEALGELEEAIAAYRNYLATGPADRSTVQASIIRLETELHDRQKRAEAAKAKEALKPVAPKQPEQDRAKDYPGRGLVIAGATTIGLGGALLCVMGGALGWGESIDKQGEEDAQDPELADDDQHFQDLNDRGMTANRLAVGTAIAGGVATLVGVGLLSVGLVRKSRSRRASIGPGPTRAGVSLVVRF